MRHLTKSASPFTHFPCEEDAASSWMEQLLQCPDGGGGPCRLTGCLGHTRPYPNDPRDSGRGPGVAFTLHVRASRRRRVGGSFLVLGRRVTWSLRRVGAQIVR